MWNSLIIDPMVNLLFLIYSFLGHNFGIAIIIFTILIRLITYPLNASQLKSSKAMQDMQKSKKWQDIQKKYKGDREKLSQEQMALYKEMGVSPFASCLPLLIQFPVMIGLYQAIIRALAITPTQLLDLSKHIYPFFTGASSLIPINNHFLWMDLAQPERLIIAGIGIPVLTILVVITSYMQSKVMTPSGGTPGDQSTQMAQTMTFTMPLMMGFISYTLSSGLAIYFVISNVLGIIQPLLMGTANLQNLLPSRATTGK